MQDGYVMPSVDVGDTVMFAKEPGASEGWTFGLVDEVGERNICVWVPKCPDNWFRENVRHISDPVWKNDRKREHMLEDNDSGVFMVRPKDQAFNKLKEDYARLRALVEQLLPNGIPEPTGPQLRSAEEVKNKRPKGKKKDGPKFDHMQPGRYEEDEIPEGAQVIEIEEDDDNTRGDATLEDYVTVKE